MSTERESTCGDRLEFIFTNMIGHVVLVHTLDGAQWEGIFVSRTDEAKDDAHSPGDYFLLSEVRNRQSAVHTGQDASIIFPHLAVAAQDIVYVETPAIRIEAVAHGRVEPFRSSPLTEITQDWSEFPVESSLGGAKGGSSLSDDLETEERQWVAGKWDQFEANKKFGVVSTYSEDQYTTKLDKSKFTREQMALAERLSHEIERSQARGGIQHRIERGEEVEGDEGTLYSDVGRTVKPGAASSPSIAQAPVAVSSAAVALTAASAPAVATVAVQQQASATTFPQPSNASSGRAPMPIEDGLSAPSLSSTDCGDAAARRVRAPPPPLAPLAVVVSHRPVTTNGANTDDSCSINLLWAVGRKLEARNDTRRCLPDWPGEGDSYDIETSDFKKTAEEHRHHSSVPLHQQHLHHVQQPQPAHFSGAHVHPQQQLHLHPPQQQPLQGHPQLAAHHHQHQHQHQHQQHHGGSYAQQQPVHAQAHHARAHHHQQHQHQLHHHHHHHHHLQHAQHQQHVVVAPPLPPPQQSPLPQPSGGGGSGAHGLGPHHLGSSLNALHLGHHPVSAAPPAPPATQQQQQQQHMHSLQFPQHDTANAGSSHHSSSLPTSSTSSVNGVLLQQIPHAHLTMQQHMQHHQQHLHHHHHVQHHHLHHVHQHHSGSLSAPPQLLAGAPPIQHHPQQAHHHHHQQQPYHHHYSSAAYPSGGANGSSDGGAQYHQVHRAQSDGPRSGRSGALTAGSSSGSASSGGPSTALSLGSRTQPQQPIPTGSFAPSAAAVGGNTIAEGSPLTPPPAAATDERRGGHSALQRGAKGLHSRQEEGLSNSNLPSPGNPAGTRPTTSPGGTPQRGAASIGRGGRPASPPAATAGAPSAPFVALGSQ